MVRLETSLDLNTFFDRLWDDFVQIAPAAGALKERLEARGERVLNDHIAFRTYDRGPIALDRLEPHLLGLGYVRYAPYRFEEKKLRAYGYVHATHAHAPKIFLSELLTDELSAGLRAVVDGLCAQVPADFVTGPEVFWAGRPWAPIARATWQTLLDESEYAAWMAAFGLHANHFTVFINALSQELRSVPKVLDFVEAAGFRINTSGGRVKGTPSELLEQGSTMADVVPVAFADGVFPIPSCYYEFALRHPTPEGELFQGFVAASADKIFESTDVGR